MPIKDLPISLRPREKAMLQGVNTLSDIEILAIVLRSGTQELDVLSLSKKLLERYKSLDNLSQISLDELKKFKGIGNVKAIEILAVFEIIKRVNKTHVDDIANIKEAFDFAFPIIGNDLTEKFLIVLVDLSGKILYYEILYKGIEDQVIIEPKEIMALILKKGAKRFYCFHNHPSGDHRPSEADKQITNRLKNYSSIFNIDMLAHIIISPNGLYSILS